MNTDTATMQAGPETATDTGSTQPSTPAKPARSPRTKPAGKRSAKPAAKAAKPAKSSAKLVKSGPDGTPLKTLLAKLKLPADGRAARRKLRKANFSWHDPKSRWNLNAKQLAQAEAILTGEE